MRCAFYLIVFVLLAGCATLPPDRIENNAYISAKYEFEVYIPAGFTATKEFPSWMDGYIKDQDKKYLLFLLFNKNINGIIYVYGRKSCFCYDISTFNIHKRMDEYFKKTKEKIKKDKYTRDYKYSELGGCNCFSGVCGFYEEFIIDTEFMEIKAKKKTFIYGCHNDDTCFITIALASDSKFFNSNNKAFELMVESLKTGFVY